MEKVFWYSVLFMSWRVFYFILNTIPIAQTCGERIYVSCVGVCRFGCDRDFVASMKMNTCVLEMCCGVAALLQVWTRALIGLEIYTSSLSNVLGTVAGDMIAGSVRGRYVCDENATKIATTLALPKTSGKRRFTVPFLVHCPMNNTVPIIGVASLSCVVQRCGIWCGLPNGDGRKDANYFSAPSARLTLKGAFVLFASVRSDFRRRVPCIRSVSTGCTVLFFCRD